MRGGGPAPAGGTADGTAQRSRAGRTSRGRRMARRSASHCARQLSPTSNRREPWGVRQLWTRPGTETLHDAWGTRVETRLMRAYESYGDVVVPVGQRERGDAPTGRGGGRMTPVRRIRT